MQTIPNNGTLELVIEDEWLTVWFNEPERRNPLTSERVNALRDLCSHLQSRPDIRGVVFRGQGGIFCAGADLKAFDSLLEDGEIDRQEIMDRNRAGGELFRELNCLPQFTMMAVEGAAIAGGMGLACTGDMVVADRAARFALSEVHLGIIPAQIAPYLIDRLGMRMARRLTLTGATLIGEEAYKAGLADVLVDGANAMNEAVDSVRAQVKRCAPSALAATKRLLREMPGKSREDQITLAAERFTQGMLEGEAREGMKSFLEKRKPDWAGEK